MVWLRSRCAMMMNWSRLRRQMKILKFSWLRNMACVSALKRQMCAPWAEMRWVSLAWILTMGMKLLVCSLTRRAMHCWLYRRWVWVSVLCWENLRYRSAAARVYVVTESLRRQAMWLASRAWMMIMRSWWSRQRA